MQLADIGKKKNLTQIALFEGTILCAEQEVENYSKKMKKNWANAFYLCFSHKPRIFEHKFQSIVKKKSRSKFYVIKKRTEKTFVLRNNTGILFSVITKTFHAPTLRRIILFSKFVSLQTFPQTYSLIHAFLHMNCKTFADKQNFAKLENDLTLSQILIFCNKKMHK